MKISAIVAADTNDAIGYQNQLLCHLPNDLKFFKNKTSGHHVLMGRKTYDSIGKPLPNRTFLIVSRDTTLRIDGCHVFNNIETAIQFAQNNQENELMIIGGSEIYQLTFPLLSDIYITRIHHAFEKADSYFPKINAPWELIATENHFQDDKNPFDHSFEHWTKK